MSAGTLAVSEVTLSGGSYTTVIVVALVALVALVVAGLLVREVLARRRHRQHEEHRCGHPGRRIGLPEPAVQDVEHLRGDRLLRAVLARRTPPVNASVAPSSSLVGAVFSAVYRVRRDVAGCAGERARRSGSP